MEFLNAPVMPLIAAFTCGSMFGFVAGIVMLAVLTRGGSDAP